MKIKEILFNETDYSCALCGERQVKSLTEHHIDGKNNEYDNRIILCHNCHHRVTNKKGITKIEVKARKKSLIKKTLTQYGVSALKLAYRNEFGVVATPLLLYHLVGMGYMKKKEEIEGYGDNNKDYIEVEARYVVTPKGRKLHDKWLR